MNLMIKNYDFDKVVLFVHLIWLKSIDFTGVWVIFSLGFLIIYNMKFCGLSAIFWLSSMKVLIYKGFDGFFWWNSGDFKIFLIIWQFSFIREILGFIEVGIEVYLDVWNELCVNLIQFMIWWRWDLVVYVWMEHIPQISKIGMIPKM